MSHETPEKAAAGAVPPTAKPNLRDRLRLARRRQQVLAGAFAAVAAIGVFFVDRPARSGIARADAERVEFDAQRAANQSRAAALPELRAAVADLRRQVDRFKPLRSQGDIQQGFADLTRIKSETPVSTYKFETAGAPQSLGSCVEQKVRITFDADFADAMSLIRKVESMNRLTRIRALNIGAARSDAGGRGGRVSVEMSLSLFFHDGDDAPDPIAADPVAGVGQP